MRMRDALYGAAVLLVGIVHFALQWLGWKEHLEEAALQSGLLALLPEGSLWPVLSFPLFTWVPRRLQYLHFFSLLVVNSLLWAGAVVFCGSFLWGLPVRLRYRRRWKAGNSLTWADQLLELKRLRERGAITFEEYQRRREAILAGKSLREQPNRASAHEQAPAARSRGRMSA